MHNLSMRLSGEHACILGASSDLGMAIARRLSDAGLRLTLSACSNNGLARLKTAFPTATVVKINMEKIAHDVATQSGEAIDTALGKIDSPDYLVDCMQSDFEAFVAGADATDIAKYMETNISGRAICLRHISRMMLAKRSGRCVFISSTAAALPNAGQGFYAASKQAGEAIYQNLGIELGGRGITSCSLRLGYVLSGRGTAFIENNPQAIKRIPAKRAATPDEVACTIAFLLSDEARMINGTTITMDGGLTACK
ncbi:SDR family NAD(P)-dependent oxidoreductase [Halodesulfovibrio marinisediminis]|uniref:3-oxoacyl-[acyl-carrier protein] reductase n=1 Tax=Halodesulfovibrio marinisediminis DSM 17456 TaxID=1121457 RepID=A0A1N6IRC6_9BACT|nr:SDR family oxidoreductase [Halodesulfovibrio marinisediminis]SIO34525.1 3-oxoacyl-[acyl-carrier protein] reductase [Halodesulfovibrio marinisediminis DSM 17456]